MTTQEVKQKVNGKGGWIVAAGGIPLAVIISWAVNAGELKSKVEASCGQIQMHQDWLAKQESRIVKMETIYERTADDIKEIKHLLRSK